MLTISGRAGPIPCRLGALALVLAVTLALPGCGKPAGRTGGSGSASASPASTATAGRTASSPATTAATSSVTTSAAAASTAAASSTPPAPPTTPGPTATRTAAPNPIAGLLDKEWTRIPTSRPVVALTFDAGANADGVASILATLTAKRVPASFFLTGNWANSYPGQAREIAAHFRLGDHSVNHPHFSQLTDAQMRAQVLDAAATIRRVTGADPAPWFRFPYGDRNLHTIAVVNAAGYIPIGWTVDTLGWEGTSGGITGDSILARVLGKLVPGEIVLMHVGSHPTDHSTLDADTLPRVIDALRARGYGFVTLASMLP